MTGLVFAELTVLSRAGSAAGGKAAWRCRCSCGAELVVSGTDLRTGNTRSCGHLKSDAAIERYRDSIAKQYPAEHLAWVGMRRRCRDVNYHQFKYWGGRGITVCQRWLVGENGKGGFECFLEDMGPKPPEPPRTMLDRIDNEGSYYPANCRWISFPESNRNKRQGNRWGDHTREISEICTVAGCDKPAHGLGLCSIHYQQERRQPRPKVPFKPCKEPGCDKPAIGLGLCSAHYQRERRRQRST